MTERGLSRGKAIVILTASALVVAGACLKPQRAHATPRSAAAAISKLIGGRATKEGRITLKLPSIVQNGSSVPLTVSVDSPMTKADYVKAIHIVADGNPNPDVASFHFTPGSGKAQVTTRIRLAKSQTVTAFAEMSDSSVYRTVQDVKVTIGGCGPDQPEGASEMAKPVKIRMRVPRTAHKGEVVQIKTLISHVMETGHRKNRKGQKIPRKILNKFVYKYNGKEILVSDWHSAVSANPYLTFFIRAKESGTMEFNWTDDDGTVYRRTAKMKVN